MEIVERARQHIACLNGDHVWLGLCLCELSARPGLPGTARRRSPPSPTAATTPRLSRRQRRAARLRRCGTAEEAASTSSYAGTWEPLDTGSDDVAHADVLTQASLSSDGGEKPYGEGEGMPQPLQPGKDEEYTTEEQILPKGSNYIHDNFCTERKKAIEFIPVISLENERSTASSDSRPALRPRSAEAATPVNDIGSDTGNLKLNQRNFQTDDTSGLEGHKTSQVFGHIDHKMMDEMTKHGQSGPKVTNPFGHIDLKMIDEMVKRGQSGQNVTNPLPRLLREGDQNLPSSRAEPDEREEGALTGV